MKPPRFLRSGRSQYVVEQGLSSLSTFLLGVVVIIHSGNAAVGRYAIGAVEYQILITCGRSIALTPLYLQWAELAPKRRVVKALRRSLLTSGLGMAAICGLASAVPSAWPGWGLTLSLPAILAYDCGRQLLLVCRRPALSIGPAVLVAGSAGLAVAFDKAGVPGADSAWWSLAVTSVLSGIVVWLILGWRLADNEPIEVPTAEGPAGIGGGTFRAAVQSLSEALAAPVALLVVLAVLADRFGQGGLHGLRIVQTLMAPVNPLLLLVSQQQWRSVVSIRGLGGTTEAAGGAERALRGSRKTAGAAAGLVAAIGFVAAAGLDLQGSRQLSLLCLAWTGYVGAVAMEEALLPTLKVLIRPGVVTGWRMAVAFGQVVVAAGVALSPAAGSAGVTGVIAAFALIQIGGSGLHLLISIRFRTAQLAGRADGHTANPNRAPRPPQSAPVPFT